MSTPADTPPPPHEEPKDFAAKAKALASRTRTAGQLVAKQAERTKLLQVTLPSHYRALGKHLYEDGSRRDEFATEFQAVDGLVEQIKTIHSRSADEPKAEGFTAKTKAAAKAVQIPDIRLTAKAISAGSLENNSATQVNMRPIRMKRGAPGG